MEGSQENKKEANWSNDLEYKILGGYFYRLSAGTGRSKMEIMTGQGGVLDFIRACREEGLSDSIIEESIFVGIGKDWIPLTNVNVKTT